MAKVLVLSAHPDDAELCAGGTIRKLTAAGISVVLVDCTKGELGTRGTPERRAQEADQAGRILGVDERIILSMPDGSVADTDKNRLEVVRMYREFRPTIVLTSPPVERHPDHEAVHRLARAACFLSGLHHIRTEYRGKEQQPHRPLRTFCYQHQTDFPQKADLYVDITQTWDDKVAAILAFASQFHVPDSYTSNEPSTILSNPEFLLQVEGRARYFGSLIGTVYAESFLSVEPLGVDSLSAFL